MIDTVSSLPVYPSVVSAPAATSNSITPPHFLADLYIFKWSELNAQLPLVSAATVLLCVSIGICGWPPRRRPHRRRWRLHHRPLAPISASRTPACAPCCLPSSPWPPPPSPEPSSAIAARRSSSPPPARPPSTACSPSATPALPGSVSRPRSRSSSPPPTPARPDPPSYAPA